MHYSDIRKNDIANGPGVRVTIFVSGCTHKCKGCFNQELWDFSYGKPFTNEQIEEIVDALRPDYIAGLTLLGGEPLEYANQLGLLPLLRQVKATYPHKSIWCYTGYTYEEDVLSRFLKEYECTSEFLSYVDVLVDGEFVMEKKNISLVFRGSENQRIIDLRRSLNEKKTILMEDYMQK